MDSSRVEGEGPVMVLERAEGALTAAQAQAQAIHRPAPPYSPLLPEPAGLQHPQAAVVRRRSSAPIPGSQGARSEVDGVVISTERVVSGAASMASKALWDSP